MLVPYRADQMFDLVADVERYPEFVPGYREASVERREGDTWYTVQRVGLGAVTARFHSVATVERPHRIRIRSVESPFQLLELEWQFEPQAEGARITFRVRAQLGEGLTERLLQPWFARLAEQVPAAFVARARRLYGQRGAGAGPGPT